MFFFLTFSLSKHINDLLSLALSDSDIGFANLVMDLFYCKCSALLEAAAESNFFVENESFYLSDEASYLQISKFAELTEICVTYASDINESFSYIPKLLNFTEYDTVTLSIISLLDNDDNFNYFHLVMKSNNFVKQVVNNIVDLRKCQIGGNKLGNLYKILLKCAKNEILAKSCNCPSVIEVALDVHDDDETCVLNSQWNLIYELCIWPCFKDHSSMVEYAISIIIPDEYELYNEYNVVAIDFISRTLESYPSEAKNVDFSLLSNIIISIFKYFPNHTIALTSAVHLLIVMLSLEEAIDIVYDTVVPFLIKCVEDDNQKILRVFSISGIKKIVNLGDTIDNLALSDKFENDDDFVNICNTKILQYENIKKRAYGDANSIYDHVSFNEMPPLKIPQTVE